MTPSGIEPATFRFVAQHLNHCATAVLISYCASSNFKCLEAAQMKFFRHLLGITKLDKEKIQCITEKTGAQNIVKETK